jgi:hypothetical protein
MQEESTTPPAVVDEPEDCDFLAALGAVVIPILPPGDLAAFSRADIQFAAVQEPTGTVH